jgi:hypothetical protein
MRNVSLGRRAGFTARKIFWIIFRCERYIVYLGSFEFRVGKLCESLAADTLSAQQKEVLAEAINLLFGRELQRPSPPHTLMRLIS